MTVSIPITSTEKTAFHEMQIPVDSRKYHNHLFIYFTCNSVYIELHAWFT